MDSARWQYLKNLQPSPGRYVVMNSHPNRHTRRKLKLYDKVMLDVETGRYEVVVQPVNKPYRNPSKRQRRLAIKLLGRRQLLKSFKHVKREITL